jgi:integrase
MCANQEINVDPGPMSDLAVLPEPTELATLADDELEAAREYAEAEKAAATREAYGLDWRIFTTWCAARGLLPLPATPATIARFIASEANAGRKVSTITRRCSAIRYAHKLAGHEPPTNAESVRAVMRGIRRSIGTATDRKAPATHDVIANMLTLCPATMGGKRDRALLTFGFAGAFRRSELVALNVADLTEAPDGYRVLIRRSKGDQEAQGQEIAIPRGYWLRPVEAVQTWLEAAGIEEGPIFRPVLKSGVVLPIPLKPRAILVIVKRYARRAGLDVHRYSAHSLRAGFITSAAEAGANLMKIMDQSRHKSLDTVRGYVRSAEAFKDHAGASFL